ncbi:MAG TPA: cation:proton antiporter [bacterium]|nr:cation:proton antiporter [bacterium]
MTNQFDFKIFFIAIILLFGLAQICGILFHKLRMPKVIGEIFGGVLLGNTLLGYFFPEIHKTVFANQYNFLLVIYWFGLVLLMFISGFEIDFNFEKKDLKTVSILTVTTTIIPFLCGWYLTDLINLKELIGTSNNLISLKLVISISIAITSIPVISKIFFDLNIINTNFAKIVLGTATMHDIVLWIFLAIATGLVSSTVLSISVISKHIFITLGFFAICLLFIPKIIDLLRKFDVMSLIKNYEFGIIIFILLSFVVLAGIFDVNVIFGAFLAGIAVGYLKNPEFIKAKNYLKEFSLVFFVPIYFSIVGLKLDFIRQFNPLFFLLYLIAAFLIQWITVYFTAKLLKYGNLASMNLAVAMNARGGPGIVLATVALELGIINENFFTTLISLSLATSLITGVWLKYIINKGLPLLDE